jgi:16S rRNA (guanine527-N7)-methyltransferase
MVQKNIFNQFLFRHFPANAPALLKRFEAYHSWLVEENAKINLISRQVDPDDIWTTHFLDSLLSIQYVDFRGRKILDFGTGGGLPGIPLAIAYRDAEVTLLDSTKKKIAAVKRAAEGLGLKNCHFGDYRLEDINAASTFDLIVSRSVKITPAYKSPLLTLLKPSGKIILYKSKILDDIHQFSEGYGVRSVDFFDVGDDVLGERKIVIITKK